MDALLIVACIASAVAALVWGRWAQMRSGLLEKTRTNMAESANSSDAFLAFKLARLALGRELHAFGLYAVLAIFFGYLMLRSEAADPAILGLLVLPFAVLSVAWYRNIGRENAMARERLKLEQRITETMSQQNLAPRAWAARLAPDELPDFEDFELGRVYQAGSGLMAGDFFDVFRLAPSRVAAVIGDVSGKGIESSITAFQAKYLLRVFLRQFRDPAQALEELNQQMSATGHSEEFISLVVVVFDTKAGTLRLASAGHPAAFVWHEREVQPLRSTGPLLMLSPKSSYYSREFEMERGDMIVLYTDGLAEARRENELFGEDRIAMLLRRDPTVHPDVLCNTLLEAARTFAEGPVADDVAILAVKRL